jgi:hypothetical protein
MGDAEGADDNSIIRVFRRKNVSEIRSFLRKHHPDVNTCHITLSPGGYVRGSIVRYAFTHFNAEVITCLLEEFGADLSIPCVVCDEPGYLAQSYPIFYACFSLCDRADAVEYVLEHGGSPFTVDFGKSKFLQERVDGLSLLLLEYAKTRCRTAWALVWTLSQLTGTIWPDMSEPFAEMIVGIHLREFSKDSSKKKRV